MHVWSPCVEPALGEALSSTGGASVIVQSKHERRLAAVVLAMQQHALSSGCEATPLPRDKPPGNDGCDRARPNVFMLLRWNIMLLA